MLFYLSVSFFGISMFNKKFPVHTICPLFEISVNFKVLTMHTAVQ